MNQFSALSRPLRERGEHILDQEFWLFGQDIRRDEGNLLLQFGFSKERAPRDTPGSNTYSLVLDDDSLLTLWGFGFSVWRSGTGRIFVPRFRLEPVFTKHGRALPPVWRLAHLGETIAPKDADDWRAMAALLVPALQFLSGYEAWVIETAGIAYREHCLLPRGNPVCDPIALPATILGLAEDCDNEITSRFGARDQDWLAI